MKLNKIYLHVGMQKTATSSIQQSLYANRNFLQDNSILYPSSWSNWHVYEIGALLFEEKEEERRNILHRKNFTEIDRVKIIEKLKYEIMNCECESLVISSESMILYSNNGLSKLKNIIQNDLNIKNIVVIISTRNIIDFMNSYVQQLIKSSFMVNYNELVNITPYKNQITKFEEVFGRENLIVYSFEEAKSHPFGVVGSFFQHIGVDENKLQEIKIINTNEGISEIACDILEYINIKEPFISHGEISVKREIGDALEIQKFSGKKFIMNETFQRVLLQNNILDAEWLKNNYNIDYTDIKTTQKSRLKFCETTFIELKEIFPRLNQNIQKIVKMYFEDKLKNTRFYDMNNKNNLKRILRYIEKAEKMGRYDI